MGQEALRADVAVLDDFYRMRTMIDRAAVFTGAWRVLFSLAVTYAFIIALMTASAQQHIASALAEKDAGLDYSSAYARGQEVPALKRNLEIQRAGMKLATRERVKLQTSRDEVMAVANGAWSRFMQVAGQLPQDACGPVDFASYDAIWQWASQCLSSGDVPVRQRGPLSEILSQQPNALSLMADQGIASREVERLEAEEAEAKRIFDEAQVNLDLGRQVSLIFDELDALNTPWLPGAKAFEKFPPVLMNIILALVSGAFGALLVTLIIYVYPTNGFSFATGRGFEPRVMLGGAISIGVYIVLGGGAAVLGSSQSLEGGATNVMTFCAVGVLAGMFSDRVAFWLSDRAEMFFARQQVPKKQ